MSGLVASLDQLAARTRFSGVVRVDRHGSTELERAYGEADRAHRVANTVGTRFAIASGTKGWTALTVVRLIELGHLGWATTARSVLGRDLPLVADDVTVGHLLAHRSGIGDYIDEEDEGLDLDAYLLTVPVHELATTEGYVRALEGRETKFPAGERFSYSNSGYVVLALIAERVSGLRFPDLVERHVCRPAGLEGTAFLRSDELPGDAALGYLTVDGLRTNVLHLPVRGSGDGGLFTTAADVRSLWTALFAGGIVTPDHVAEATRVHGRPPDGSGAYGLGFWLDPEAGTVSLVGADAGVSFRSVHHPGTDTTVTVLANTGGGAWPVARHLVDTWL